jgi:hypothetical protein
MINLIKVGFIDSKLPAAYAKSRWKKMIAKLPPKLNARFFKIWKDWFYNMNTVYDPLLVYNNLAVGS